MARYSQRAVTNVLDNDTHGWTFSHDVNVNLVDADALVAVGAVWRIIRHQVLVSVLRKAVTSKVQERCNDERRCVVK